MTAEFDWHQEGPQIWDIDIGTTTGAVCLSAGGARLEVDGRTVSEGPDREYPALYRRITAVLDAGESETDLAPMVHVADAFTLGRLNAVEPFEF